MTDIQIDISNAVSFFTGEEVTRSLESLEDHRRALLSGTGKGNDFLGWVNLPSTTDTAMINRIVSDAHTLSDLAEVFVVVGIGGSYLGARAVIEAISGYFPAVGSAKRMPEVIFAGHHLDEKYYAELLNYLDEKDYCLAVISKSGTTTEPALAFRILKKHMERKYGSTRAASRIVAITDSSKGALKRMADKNGYRTYTIPDDVGGRYSVLTPVGLLPVAVAGFDIGNLISGALKMEKALKSAEGIASNPAALYAAVRNILYGKGKWVEVLVNYQPRLFYFAEWWKQLFGESEGKGNNGIWPSSAGFTTDLHSLGQYIQEGRRDLFETVISVAEPGGLCQIPLDPENIDGLNYLNGKSLHDVNRTAEKATTMAHVKGGVPVITINIPGIDENVLGQLIYFFEFSCALSGYMLGVNPFDQPGVEEYKNNMFALLGKPGYDNPAAGLE